MHRHLSPLLALAISLILLASPATLAGQDPTGTGADVAGWHYYDRGRGDPGPHPAPRAIVMISSNEGWAVGDGGLIMHWNGAAWSQVPSPTTYELRGLTSVGANDLWAVGAHGTILHGDGVSWSVVPSPTTENLLTVSMSSTTDGWISVDTNNGVWFLHWSGSAWAPVVGLGQSFRATALAARSPTEAWASTEGHILRWQGSSWAEFPTGYVPGLTAMAFVSDADGWGVARYGTMMHWDGSTWSFQSSGTRGDLAAIAMSSAGEGWAVGAKGAIVRRHEGVWSAVATPTTSDLRTVAMSPDGTAWAAGDDTLLHWDGSWWSAWGDPAVTPHDLNDVALVPAGNCIDACADAWAVGYEGSILRYMEDPGGNDGLWRVAPSPTSYSLRSVAVLSADDGWAVGGGGVILRWDGSNWLNTPSPTRQMLYDVAMAASSDGWAIGLGGTILHWNGTAWQTVSSPVRNDLSALAVIAANDVWAVGSGPWLGQSTALHWDGKTWLAVPVPGNPSLTGVTMISARDGWAVGMAGAIRHWDGSAWSAVASPTADDLLTVDGTSATNIWATGMHGTLLHWDGAAWSVVASPTSRAVFGLSMSPNGHSWAVAWGGVILEQVVPSLALDRAAGGRGSYFNLTGEHFPNNTAARIDINGRTLGTAQVTASGRFTVTLDTQLADPGYYMLTSPEVASISARLRIDPAGSTWPREGEYVVWNVPAGIAGRMLYLPVVLR
jgi:hypothetical protein